jgi:hypothetical protein
MCTSLLKFTKCLEKYPCVKLGFWMGFSIKPEATGGNRAAPVYDVFS